MSQEHLEKMLEVISKNLFQESSMQYVYKIGAMYYNNKIDEFMDRGYEIINSTQLALKELAEYMFKLSNFKDRFNLEIRDIYIMGN